jgi:VanZ family protein
MISWLEERRYLAVILTVLIAIEIFWFSSLPGIMPQLGEGFNIKLAPVYHFTIFFLFNFFLIVSWSNNIKSRYVRNAIIFSVLYAIIDEVHQIFVPFRTPSIGDIFLDSAGIFLSTIVYMKVKNKNKREMRPSRRKRR